MSEMGFSLRRLHIRLKNSWPLSNMTACLSAFAGWRVGEVPAGADG